MPETSETPETSEMPETSETSETPETKAVRWINLLKIGVCYKSGPYIPRSVAGSHICGVILIYVHGRIFFWYKL